MRQAGRYMPEYRAIRKQYSLIEICKKPEVAAQVTIEAAEILKVDAAIIFADLLLPLEVMGLPFHFAAGEGPKIEKPVRTAEDIARLRTDRASDLGYVSEAVKLVCKHFGEKLPVIGFCGAPFTLASYMIEGGGSRNYLFTKKMMYSAPAAWNELMKKLVAVTAEYSTEQVRAGADTIQIFDSWVGCLSVEDYRRYVLPHVTDLVNRLHKTGVPVIYFGTDSSTLLPSMQEAGAEVDWSGLAHSPRHRMAEPRPERRSAGKSGSGPPVRRLERTQEAGGRHFASGRRTSRPHLQSRPRHSSGNSGGERESPLRFHPRPLSRFQGSG